MKLTDSKFKLETVLLNGLFVVCMVICGLFLTSMVTIKPAPIQLASNAHVSAAAVHAPSA
jgi:hypothetical protein